MVTRRPGPRAAVLEENSEVSALLAEAEAARTGHRPDDFAVRVLVAALTGAMAAAMQAGPEAATVDYVALVDRAFAVLEGGAPR